MKAAVVGEDRIPKIVDVEPPVATAGYASVEMRAAALTNLDVMIAEGRHYFSPSTLPAWVGREGVAVTDTGERVYLNVNAIPVPYGSMAERSIADLSYSLPVPDGIDDALAAALGNAGLAAWLPLSWRARLMPGESVLILGATGNSGLIAVAAAAALGAGRIVAAGRSDTGLERARSLGATETVKLGEGDLPAKFRAVAEKGFDVVIDYLNGEPAEAALQVMALGGRMVQIGSGLAPGIHMPAQLGRRQSLSLLGFAYYHAPIEEERTAYASICRLAMAGSIFIDLVARPLSDFPLIWADQKSGGRQRQVVLPHG